MAKVLLADESITIQKVVDLVLSEEGHEIKSVNSGDEALSAVQAFGPDIIIADVKIRGKNGYQIARAIKGGQGTSHIPVLLLSGAFEPVDEKKLKESGADGSIVKPFESRDLIEKINELVKGSAAPVSAETRRGRLSLKSTLA
jgi:CheY-like chemotaxis protein